MWRWLKLALQAELSLEGLPGRPLMSSHIRAAFARPAASCILSGQVLEHLLNQLMQSFELLLMMGVSVGSLMARTVVRI